jgi:chorismate-pyruvate lyase
MNNTSPTTHLPLNASDLYALFGQGPPPVRAIDPGGVPQPYSRLLAHENHMTVTLERHHGGPVELVVLDQRRADPLYARKIVLLDSGDRRAVQFGLMQFDFRHCRPEVRDEILQRSTPLGRILIENEVLRRISTHQLLEITPDDEIRRHFGLSAAWPGRVYGRLATIFCNEEPAVNLLEIVAPQT